MRSMHDADRDIRIPPGKCRDCPVQLQPAVAAQIADPQLARRIGAARLRLTDQVVHLFQDGLALAIEVFTGRRQGKPAVRPVDQLHAQLLLQRLNLLGNRRLRDITLRRSLGKAVAVHHGCKVLHLSEQQNRSPLSPVLSRAARQQAYCSISSLRVFQRPE